MLNELTEQLLDGLLDFLGQTVEKRPFRVVFGFFIISALVLNHDKILGDIWNNNDWIKSLLYSAILAVSFYYITKILVIARKLSLIEKQAQDAIKTISQMPVFLKRLSEHIKFEDDFEDFIHHSSENSINGSLAKHLKNSLFERLQVDNKTHQFSAQNKWAAIEVYELFWRELLELQKTNATPLTCYAINSSSLDVWSGIDGKLFLDIQAEFCSGKRHPRGEVHRILCYSLTDFREKTDLGKKIDSVAVAMMQAGVSVYFYDTDESLAEHSFKYYQIEKRFFREWDFLVVEGNEESIIWKTESLEKHKRSIVPGMPEQAICAGSQYYIDDKNKPVDLKELWNEVKRHSKELELAEDKSNESGWTAKSKDGKNLD